MKGRININKELCKECQLCIQVCPKNLIQLSEEFNSKGYHPIRFSENGECTGCTVCAIMCPEIAIEVYRE